MRVLLSPRLLGAHLLALVCVAIASGLGVWQYDAWSTSRALEAQDLTRLDPVALDDAMGPDDRFPGDSVGVPVILEGVWLPESTVYISGRETDGVDGFWVVTSLAQGSASGSALPVVRGWTPSPEEAPPAPTGAAELVGLLQPAEGTGVSDDDPTDDVLPQVRTADLIQRVDQDLYDAYAVIPDEVAPGQWPHGADAVNDGTADLEPASIEQLPPAGRFTALRNLLYALEWWVFAGFAAFIWWRYVRDVTRLAHADRDSIAATEPVASQP